MVVHRFQPGRIVCRCGQRVVRRPVKAPRIGWDGRGHPRPAAGQSEEEDPGDPEINSYQEVGP